VKKPRKKKEIKIATNETKDNIDNGERKEDNVVRTKLAETPKRIDIPDEVKKIKHKDTINSNSPKKQKLDSSIDNGYQDRRDERREDRSKLPSIKMNNALPIINMSKDHQKYIDRDPYKSKNDGSSKGSSNHLIKILPYVNNEHISNAYKYNPSYIKQSPVKNYIKNGGGDKGVYKNNYNYIDKKINLDGLSINGSGGKGLPMIPNRKLSPIRRQIKA